MKIGITGGIGSGKTTVCRIFEEFGIPVYFADARAKDLMYRNKALKADIKKLLGNEAYHSNGTLNRAYVASEIFSDKSLLASMNALVHPAVGKDYLAWHEAQASPYTLKEAALLVENGSYKTLDKLITVTAESTTRIERVMKRDNITEEDVKARMKNQLPESEKIAVADYIIDNNGDKSLIQQVWHIHQQLLSLSNV